MKTWQTVDRHGNHYKVIIDGLKSPRAVRVDSVNSYLYWTEVGEEPRVARISLNSTPHSVETLALSEEIKQPNGLHIDHTKGKLYVGDGFFKYILECNLDGSNCQKLPLQTTPSHIFSLTGYNSSLFFSDWKQASVTQIRVSGEMRNIASGLMRPTNIVVQYTDSPDCPSDHGCSDSCVADLGGYRCDCPQGLMLAGDGITCVPGVVDWRRVQDALCDPSCGANSVCVEDVSGTRAGPSCQCDAGYTMESLGRVQTCRACSINKYKPDIGDDSPCVWCPQTGAQTPEGSTYCKCPNGQYWNTVNKTCLEDKPGTCPLSSVSPLLSCTTSSACESDTDCSGDQKCCSQCGAGTRHCLDPLRVNQCIHNGFPQDIGSTFSSQTCTSCQCSKSASSPFAVTTCSIEDCPVLPCSGDDQTLSVGQCCPVCNPPDPGLSPESLIIEYCPHDEVFEVSCPDDSDLALHDFYINPYDLTGLDRSINITKTPVGNYYKWTNEHITVKWTATAPRTDGSLDVAVCTYQVKVKDSHPPSIRCPSDVVMYTSANSAPVEWLAPITTDNVGVTEISPQISSGLGWGSRYPLGRHKITYTVTDITGNQNQCFFNIIVNKLTSAVCDVIPPLNGELRCVDSGRGVAACSLLCDFDRGFVLNPSYNGQYQFDCVKGTWSPQLPEHYRLDACVVITQETFKQSVTLFVPSCIPGIRWSSAQTDFQDRVYRHYTEFSDQRVAFSIDVNKTMCENSDGKPGLEYVIFTLSISKQYRSDSKNGPWQDRLTAAFHDMLDATLSGRLPLIRPVAMATHYYNTVMAPVLSVNDLYASSSGTSRFWGCTKGQIYVDKGCLVCPAGMYQTSAGCVPCPTNTYQPRQGQTACVRCSPPLTTNGNGAYHRLMCKGCHGDACSSNHGNGTVKVAPVGDGTQHGINIMMVGIIVGVAVILIVVIIVVVVVFVKKHREKMAKSQNSSQEIDLSFANPMYGETRSEVSLDQKMGASNNNEPKTKKKTDKGSVRSTGSTSSAMARAYPYMPEKEVEITVDEKGQIDLLKEIK